MTEATVQEQPFPRKAAASSVQGRKYLPEVQGLRAVAVLMVVTYHVWFGRISGGVDVFLLISAFLLTGQFMRKLDQDRGLDLLKYWAHLFKRLLPLIVFTLWGTLMGVYILMPETAWTSMLGQTWASLFYYQNWFLAADSVNYYATDRSGASPLQHFWSLSIQGQIFIIWPILFALAAVISRAAKVSVRAVLVVVFGLIFSLSLVFSIITTNNNQAFAYFDTRTRLWEFALGSLLALVLPHLVLGKSVRMLLGWVGMAALLSCGFVLQVDQKFPGYMALWPTLAAAFIIIAGFTGSKMGVDRLLSWKPLNKLGDSSYALYLIHWPVLVFFLHLTGRDQAGLKGGAAVVLVSVLGAVVATKLIDSPIRKNTWFSKNNTRAVFAISLCIALVAAPLGGWQLKLHAKESAMLIQEQSSQAEMLRNYPGALSLQVGFEDASDDGVSLRPALTALDKQWVSLESGCVDAFVPSDPVLAGRCGQSLVDGDVKKTILIVGDSHAEQFAGALIPVAKENDWQLVSLLLGGCDFGSESAPSGRSKECREFNEAALRYVMILKPDALYTVATNAVPDSPEETVVPGYDTAVRSIAQAGIRVLGIRDTPRFSRNIASCVSISGADACAFEQSTHLAGSNPAGQLNKLENVHMVDLTDQYCKDGRCHAAAGNILVFMDDNHLTWDYARTMASALGQRIAYETGWEVKQPM